MTTVVFFLKNEKYLTFPQKECILKVMTIIEEGEETMLKSRVCIITALFCLFSISGFAQEWVKQTTGLPEDLGTGASFAAVDEQVAVATAYAGIYQTVDGGKTWRQLTIPGDMTGSIADVAITDSFKIWIATSGGQIFATQDAGDHWIKQFEDSSLTNFMNYIEMFDANNGIAMGDNAQSLTNPAGAAIFLRTSDGGENWISVNDSAFGAYSGDIWRRVDFVNELVGYFYASGAIQARLYKTMDGGHSWQATNLPSYAQMIKFYDEKIGLVISKAQEVWRTLDGGESWQSFSTPHTGWGTDIEFSPQNPALVWMTDNSKIYFSSDTGRTWVAQFDKGGSDLEFVSKNAGWCAGIHGVLHFQMGTSFVPAEKKIVLQNFRLFQNYPNPFNSSTRIHFNLPQPQKVLMEIFDIRGNFVDKLIDENLLAGNHEILWNGNKFSSGTYFCRLTGGRTSRVLKLILLK